MFINNTDGITEGGGNTQKVRKFCVVCKKKNIQSILSCDCKGTMDLLFWCYSLFLMFLCSCFSDKCYFEDINSTPNIATILVSLIDVSY